MEQYRRSADKLKKQHNRGKARKGQKINMGYNTKLLKAVLNWMNLIDPSGMYETFIDEIKSGYLTINEALFHIENILNGWQRVERQRGNTEKITEILKWKNTLIFMYE